MTAMAKVEMLRAACCIAGADRKVDEGELVLLKKLAAHVGVGKASLDAMILRAETEPDFYKTQFQVLKLESESTMTILLEVAASDGRLDKPEVEMLKAFATRLDMTAEAFTRVAEPVLAKIKPA